MPKKQFMLGIDVGGQSIKTGLYAVDKGDLSKQASWIDTQETHKGVREHAAQIVDIIQRGADLAKTLEGTVVGVGIASPGRFGIDGIIKPGTNPNLGRVVHEFDGIHLRGEYVRAMQAQNPQLLSIPFNVKNDGNAMLAGMVKSLLSRKRTALHDHVGVEINPDCLKGKYIGLIGLGTGLGHAIVQVDGDHHYRFVTDGHASKLRIPVDAEDLPLLKQGGQVLKAASGKEEIVLFDDGSIRAEDLYRSPMVNAMAGVESGEEINIQNNPHHLRVIRMAGKYLARTMLIIRSGKSEDIEPENGWTDEEKALAAKTSIYLFGGGLGRSPLGKVLMDFAAQELEENGVTDIRMAQIADVNVAADAAAIMAYDSLCMGITEQI